MASQLAADEEEVVHLGDSKAARNESSVVSERDSSVPAKQASGQMEVNLKN